jgi:hypothetical protein
MYAHLKVASLAPAAAKVRGCGGHGEQKREAA